MSKKFGNDIPTNFISPPSMLPSGLGTGTSITATGILPNSLKKNFHSKKNYPIDAIPESKEDEDLNTIPIEDKGINRYITPGIMPSLTRRSNDHSTHTFDAKKSKKNYNSWYPGKYLSSYFYPWMMMNPTINPRLDDLLEEDDDILNNKKVLNRHKYPQRYSVIDTTSIPKFAEPTDTPSISITPPSPIFTLPPVQLTPRKKSSQSILSPSPIESKDSTSLHFSNPVPKSSLITTEDVDLKPTWNLHNYPEIALTSVESQSFNSTTSPRYTSTFSSDTHQFRPFSKTNSNYYSIYSHKGLSITQKVFSETEIEKNHTTLFNPVFTKKDQELNSSLSILNSLTFPYSPMILRMLTSGFHPMLSTNNTNITKTATSSSLDIKSPKSKTNEFSSVDNSPAKKTTLIPKTDSDSKLNSKDKESPSVNEIKSENKSIPESKTATETISDPVKKEIPIAPTKKPTTLSSQSREIYPRNFLNPKVTIDNSRSHINFENNDSNIESKNENEDNEHKEIIDAFIKQVIPRLENNDHSLTELDSKKI